MKPLSLCDEECENLAVIKKLKELYCLSELSVYSHTLDGDLVKCPWKLTNEKSESIEKISELKVEGNKCSDILELYFIWSDELEVVDSIKIYLSILSDMDNSNLKYISTYILDYSKPLQLLLDFINKLVSHGAISINLVQPLIDEISV